MHSMPNSCAVMLSTWLVGLTALGCAMAQADDDIDLSALGRSLKIRDGHPILFVDADLLAEIRARPQNCEALANTTLKYRMRRATSPDDVEAIREEVEAFNNATHPGGYLQTSMWYGADAYINENPLSAAYGREYLRAIVGLKIPDAENQECHALGQAFAIGALYDWLHDQLDEELRHEARVALIAAGKTFEEWGYLNVDRYIGGHASCWTNPYLLVGLLAIRTDIEQESQEIQDEYFGLLGKVAHHVRDGIAPAREWIGKDGGYHMGWDYGSCYTTMLPYVVWDFATDEPTLFEGWQEQQTYWYLYALRHQNQVTRAGDLDLIRKGYNLYPQSGDCYSGGRLGGEPGAILITAARKYDNPHAKWLVNHYRPEFGDVTDWWTALYQLFDPDEGTPPDSLPLSRAFRNAGSVVMRDSWDLDRNTLAVFKSAPFFSNNHHHRDQNSFVIYYQAPLAIDSGGYNLCGAYGSRHWYDYYIRSIAHNTMLVHDPDEDFGTSRWGKNSNDGGQAMMVNREAGNLEHIVPGGPCALDGIMRYEDQPAYTYTMGDATKAYSPDKVELFERHMVYLRGHSADHPAIVVYDRVISKDPSHLKTYLLHSIGQPTVEERTFWTEAGDGIDPSNRGRLYDQVLLPEDATIGVVGGVANDREFFVATDGDGQPHNYSEEFAEDHPEEAQQEPIDRERGAMRELGGWRVEVSPPVGQAEDVFLNVLSVTDGGDDSGPVEAELRRGEIFDAVAVRDSDGSEATLVVFPRDGALADDISVPTLGCRQALVIGLSAGDTISAVVADGALLLATRATAGQPNELVSDEGTLFLRLAE